MKRNYELVVVLAEQYREDALANEQIAKIKATVENLKGKVIKCDLWGERYLTYPIGKSDKGFYAVFVLEGEDNFVSSLTRQLNINDAVVRHMCVKKDKFAPDYTEQLQETNVQALESAASGDDEFEPIVDDLDDVDTAETTSL
jgi:small subunit ribosomal protein S6